MDYINKNVLDGIKENFDDDAIKKLSISIDAKEIRKKYESGKELTRIERLCLLLAADTRDEIRELTKDDKELKEFYYKAVKRFNDDVTRYVATLRVEISDMNKEIFENEYMLSTNKLYDLVYKIGFKDCLANIVEKLQELDYSKEDIQNIIDEEIPELDPDYREKYMDDEKEED